MPEPRPQVYLITPPAFEADAFARRLAGVLDAEAVACVRLDMPGAAPDDLARAADALREVTHARDVALVVARDWALAARLGLDGVHLGDGARSVRTARADLGADAIVGAYCEASRHSGMGAAEAGTDYVAFGPSDHADVGDLLGWWSEVIEVPVVIEGGLDAARVAALAGVTDFFGIGPEIWRADDAAAALRALVAGL